MKVEKLIYDVREALKAYSDDSELDDRYILYLYDIKRAKYLRQDVNNSLRSVDSSILQNFSAKLEKAPSIMGYEFSNKVVLRSKDVIPTPLQLHNKVALTRIGALDYIARPFNFTTREKAVYSSEAPYPNAVYSFLHNDDKLYIVSDSPAVKRLKQVDITGVFEHPLDVGEFTVEILDMEYPIQPHYIDLIKKEIVNEIAQLSSIQEDKLNDSDD